MLFLLPFARADVIHTVGPIARGHINGSHKEDLANCYKSSLKLMKENNIRSVATSINAVPSSRRLLQH
ncbi:ADP-ribose glycohydrolase MACROD2 [Vulpes lagopus]